MSSTSSRLSFEAMAQMLLSWQVVAGCALGAFVITLVVLVVMSKWRNNTLSEVVEKLKQARDENDNLKAEREVQRNEQERLESELKTVQLLMPDWLDKEQEQHNLRQIDGDNMQSPGSSVKSDSRESSVFVPGSWSDDEFEMNEAEIAAIRKPKIIMIRAHGSDSGVM